MERDHAKWGPTLSRYLDIFEDRMNVALDNYLTSQETTSVAHDGLVPLSLLETMLAVGENMHIVEYQHGEKSLSVLMTTIRRYTELNEGGIFSRYYGYLCIRHIIRMICIGTLIESETLNDFLDNLDPELEDFEVTDLLADEALEQMTKALYKSDLSYVSICLGCMPPNGDAFTHVGGLSYDDVEFLLVAIWKDRRSIIILSNHGLLPGFAAFLFTLCEMTIFTKTPNNTKRWTQLQDVLLRFYVVATNVERTTLRQLSLFVDQQVQRHKLVGDSQTDEEDARTVVKSYARMFSPIFATNLAPIMLLDISNILFQYIDSLLTRKLEDRIPSAAWGGLERLWLEFDREKDDFMAAPRRGFTRRYAADIFGTIGDMGRRLSTADVRQEFTNILFETNILGLIGRTILMISREGYKPDEWDYLREGLESICEAMSGEGEVVMELAYNNATDWRKVQDQLQLLYYDIVPSRVPRRYITQAIEWWRAFGPKPAEEASTWYICAYPRCVANTFNMKPPGAKVVCGQCFSAAYCSQRCQKAHWCLKTVDSHAKTCRTSRF